MFANISKFQFFLLYFLILLIIAGSWVTADPTGFTFDPTDTSSSNTALSSTPDTTVIPTNEPVVQITTDLVGPTTTTPDQNVLKPEITGSLEQTTTTAIETVQTTIIPTITTEPQVSDTPTETHGPGENSETTLKVNESTFSINSAEETITSQVTEVQTRSDPPLNTSSDNPYYYNHKGWVINESGHDWVLDLDPSHYSGTGVQFDSFNKTFSNFGKEFAILINSSDVIFDGMGAIFDGGSYTNYGILVNNQSTGSYDTFSSDSTNSLTGINIKNITFINFGETGIFFNNVIGSLNSASSLPSSITDLNASYNLNGIEIQNSNGIEVNNNIVNDNHLRGIFSNKSSDNLFISNNATRDMFGYWFVENSNDTIINNTETGKCLQSGEYTAGFFLSGHNNNLTDNQAINNYGLGFAIVGDNNTLNHDIAANNNLSGFYLIGNNNTLNLNIATKNNWSGFDLIGDNNTLNHNIAARNNRNGFNLSSYTEYGEPGTSSGNLLTGNKAIRNGEDGFELESNNTLIDNDAIKNRGDGFYLDSNNTLIYNDAIKNWGDGFDLLSNNTLIDNDAIKNGGDGFYLDYNNTLIDNDAIKNWGDGFDLYYNNTLIDNDAIKNGGDGFYLDSNNTLTDNKAKDNRDDGYIIVGSGNNLTDNTAIENEKGFYLFGSNNTLIDNNASSNEKSGFYFRNSNNNTISGNDATGQDIGYYVNKSNSNTFTQNKGCYVWIDSSFIPVDINYCNATPKPTGTPTSSSFTMPHTWNNVRSSPSNQEETNGETHHPYDMQYVSSTIPVVLNPGQTFTGIITIKNTGTTAWTSEGIQFGLRAFGDALKFGISNIMIPPGTTVEPGQEFSFPVTLIAPQTDGTYNLQFRTFFLTPSKNGNPVATFFGDIINIYTDVSSNSKKTESFNKNPELVDPFMSPVVTHKRAFPIVTLIEGMPTPVWKPTPYLYHPTAIYSPSLIE